MELLKHTCFIFLLFFVTASLNAQNKTSISGCWESIYQERNFEIDPYNTGSASLFFEGKHCFIDEDSIWGSYYPYQLTVKNSYIAKNQTLYLNGSENAQGSYFISNDSLLITFTNVLGDTIREYFERVELSTDTLELLKKNEFIVDHLIGEYEVKEVYLGDDALLKEKEHKIKESITWKNEASILRDLKQMKTTLKYRCRKRTFKIIQVEWEPNESLTEEKYDSPATEFIVTPDDWYKGQYFELRIKKLKSTD